jgi:general secretion pathway protein K
MLRLVDLVNSQYGEDSPVSYSLIPAIIDWVDPDDDVTYLSFVTRENTGAENDYYQNLADPYQCKNAPFDVLGELMLVKGMTIEIFEGRPGDESKDIKPFSGIQSYLTVYGDGKININEASATVIQSLSERIDYALAQNIVEQRKISRYASIEQLREIPGMTPEVYTAIRGSVTVRSRGNYYTLTVTGVSGQFERRVKVLLKRDEYTAQMTPVLRQEL